MIKNIVFDFGGVIADISREQAVKAFIRLGVKMPTASSTSIIRPAFFRSWKKEV